MLSATHSFNAYAHKWPIAVGVILATVMELVDTSIVNVAFPHMAAGLGVTIDEITWVAVAYILAAVIILPMTGWLGARFGRKRYFLTSLAVFTAASVLCGTAGSLGSLVLWRIIQGLGGGALISTSQAILFESFPPHEKTLASALFGLGAMAGPALGPTLGGYLVERYAWPWIFLVNVPLGIVALALVWLFYRADGRRERGGDIGGVDVVGFALLALGLGSLQFVLERGEHYDWFSSRLISGLAVTATVALVTMVVWELRVKQPILHLRVLRHVSLTSATAQISAIGLALYGSVFALPLYAQTTLGYNAEVTGWLLFPSAVASAVGMLLTPRLMRCLSPRTLVVMGTLVLAASMFAHGTLTTESGVHDMRVPVILRGFGFGLIFVPATTAAFAGIAAHEMAHGTALFNLTRQLGGSVGISRLGVMARRFRIAGSDSLTASRRALAALDTQVQRQATMLAYRDAFRLLGIIVLVSLPLALLLRIPSEVAGAIPDDIH